jgi:CheY-like chemotaxis protein/anti-sigma regulatory factor (Ser/Thr protein kinase)
VLGLAQIGHRDHDGPARQIFDQIMDSGQLLLGIINDILDFSKIEAGKLQIEALPVDVQALLNRAATQVRERAGRKGLILTTEVASNLPATVQSDPMRLEQVLLNLLSNAVKFTDAGRVQVSAGLHEGQLVLSVTDTGIGMTPDQVQSLFRPFEQGDSSTTRQYGGTGLGLSISKRLVELLGGEIVVTSEPGMGSRFDVILPLIGSPQIEVPIVPAAKSPLSELPIGQRLAGLRVLAAEDNLINQMVLREFLTLEGAVCIMADSGAAAIECVVQQGEASFDIVLMDIQMPGMSGYEATRELQKLAPHLPVVGQTAHAMLEERIKCQEAGMVDLVVKPIDLNVLVQTIQRRARVRAL